MREMKDSGLAWIGSIPAAWELTTIGSLFKLRNEKVNDTDYPPLSVSKGGIVPQMENVAKTDANDNRKMVLKNDFVINSRSDRKQSCGVSPLEGSVSLINTVMYLSKGAPLRPEYLNYLLKNYGFAEEFYRWGHGIVADLWTTRWQEMKSILLPIPPEEEQDKLCEAIKEKSEKVDTLLANVQTQIEKLQAYKQSLITEVVTKGLDPTAPMKDSGVEWIGEIPENWYIYKLKYLVRRIESGVSVNAAQTAASDGKLGVLKTSAVSRYTFDPCENKEVNEDEEKRVSCPVKANTIIVSRMNTPDLVGACGYVADDYPNLFLPDRLWQVHFIDTINVKYIWYYLCSAYTKNYYSSLSTGTSSSMQNISQGQFGNAIVALPPENIQHKIVELLDHKCAQIDRLLAIKQQKIEKLNQYKKSLIYEYITGKREA